MAPPLPPRWKLCIPDDHPRDSTISVMATLGPEGRCDPLGGRHFPSLKKDAVVEMRVQTSALVDENEVQKWLEETAIPLFPAGEILRARIGSVSMKTDHERHVITEIDSPQPGKFVGIELKEPLVLRVRPSGYAKLADVGCEVLGIGRAALSLNEACKIVSEVFQPHRRSNSASAFRSVFYRDEGWWLPLSAYRLWIQIGGASLRSS